MVKKPGHSSLPGPPEDPRLKLGNITGDQGDSGAPRPQGVKSQAAVEETNGSILDAHLLDDIENQLSGRDVTLDLFDKISLVIDTLLLVSGT